MASKVKLTPELIEKVCKVLEQTGLLREGAAALGVGAETLRKWLVRGRETRGGIYNDLWNAVEKSRANFLLPLAHELKQRVQGGIVLRPKLKMAEDKNGRLYALPGNEIETKIDENGKEVPILVPCWVEGDSRTALLMLERQTDAYSADLKVKVDHALTLEPSELQGMLARVAGFAAERQNFLNPLERRALPEPVVPEVVVPEVMEDED